LIFWEMGEGITRNGQATLDENEDLGRVGTQLNSLFPTQWPRIPRGLWSGSNFLVASPCPPWDLLGPSEAGADHPVLPPWTARTCQRCWGPYVGDDGEELSYPHLGDLYPHPRLAILLRAPFSCERRRFPAGEPQGRPRTGLLWSGAVPAGGLDRVFGADVSASRAVSRETLLHGDGLPGRHTPFSLGLGRSCAERWARMAAAGGSEGREGERARKHPAGGPSPRPGWRLPAPPWGLCQPGTEEGQRVGLRSKGQVEAAIVWNGP
jgi:hypothetical protein